jgi:predicted kinase
MPPRTLFIIRGLPGSGKSTLGEQLAPDNCFSPDDYFTKEDGTYAFDADQLPKAIEYTQFRVEDAMSRNEPVVAAAATFTKRWHTREYRDLADKYGYSVFQLECQNDYGSTHPVPANVMLRMATRWDHWVGRKWRNT